MGSVLLNNDVEGILRVSDEFVYYEQDDYSITGITSLEHDPLHNSSNALCKIDDTHYILFYQGSSNATYVKTFSCDITGGTITQIDSYAVGMTVGIWPSMVQINFNHYIVAFRGSASYDGYIKTFYIDDNYDNITQKGSLEHDTDGHGNSLVQVNETLYALGYGGGAGNTFKTFSCDATGGTITEINSLVYSTGYNYFGNSLVKFNDTHFMVATCDDNNLGRLTLKTISIDTTGGTITEIDEYEYGTSFTEDYSLVKIDNRHVIVVGCYSSGGVVATFSFDENYENISNIDYLFITTMLLPLMIKMNDPYYLLAYSNGGDNILKIIGIDENYENIEILDTLNYAGGSAIVSQPAPVQINSLYYIVAYSGLLVDGYLQTFKIIE